MEIKEVKKQAGITLEVTGRIDTNTSVQVQADILKAFQKTEALTVDLANVDYVSSAGLRAFLIAQKTAMAKKGSFVLINVSDGVMMVLKNSGLSKVLDIR